MEAPCKTEIKKTKVSAKDLDGKRLIAISWVLEAIRNVIGIEYIRQNILLRYIPSLKPNIKKVRTFDAFIRANGEEYRDEKKDEIEKYCGEIMKIPGIMVFSACNIQENLHDGETHYQTFIVNNDRKIIYAIDPAYNKKKGGKGIYMAEVAKTAVKPAAMKHHYKFKFVVLSSPAQTDSNDVFCQTWSLYMLITTLINPEYTETELDIPSDQMLRYKILLDFYKELLVGPVGPKICKELAKVYKSILKHHEDKKILLQFNPAELILSMKTAEME